MWVLAIIVIETIIEISLFVTIGGWLGLWPTLAIVLGTGALGIALLRWQGAHVLRDAQREIVTLRNPLSHLAHRGLIAVGGILLILPGFFTDLLGLILMIPAARGLIIQAVANRIADKAVSAVHAMRHPGVPGGAKDAGIIDGEYAEIPADEDEKRGPSGWQRP